MNHHTLKSELTNPIKRIKNANWQKKFSVHSHFLIILICQIKLDKTDSSR